MLATRCCERLAKKNECPAVLIRMSWRISLRSFTTRTAAHRASLPVLHGALAPKCRLGGADAGSAAANVNLIQPWQKRKAFNTMTRIRAFIVTPWMKIDA